MLEFLRCHLKSTLGGETLQRELNDLRCLVTRAQLTTARGLEMQVLKLDPQRLEEVEFRVYSQFGDDGIIFFLLHKIQPRVRKFIEFGVQDYSESNTRYLLETKNWSGLVIDGDAAAMESLRNEEIYWRHDLTAIGAFVTRDNINHLFVEAGIRGEIGLLSLDIDGVDYWVWEAIDAVSPCLVVAEYNSVFGKRHKISIPYRADFSREKAHWSCLYWGASIAALSHLGLQKGYSLVGCNSAGNNAYFVRNDCLERAGLPRLTPEEAFVDSKFRESRNEQGRLTFLRGDQRARLIADLEVVDVDTGTTNSLGNFLFTRNGE